MNIRDAYTKLSLDPPMEFMEKAGVPRRIGATTWMLVEAALSVFKGCDVLLVGHDPAFAKALAEQCCDFIRTLKPRAKITSTQHGIKVDGGGDILYGTERNNKKHRGRSQTPIVFHDFDFQASLWEHQRGPLAAIRKLIRQRDGSFKAFDSKGTFILELTKEGGEELHNLDWNRVTLG